MSLTKKIKEGLEDYTLRKMGQDYRHAYELLSVKNLEGFKEICEAPKEKLMGLVLNQYPKTWRVLSHLSIGLDPRIEHICKELGYNELETKLFCHISKKISYCNPISPPSKKMKKFQEKIIDVIKNYYFKKIEKNTPEGYDEHKEFLDFSLKFYSDREYHLQTMNKFYKEIIPKIEERMKNKL